MKMEDRPHEEVGSHLSLQPDRYPDAFRHEDENANLLSILYGTTADEWRRTWRAQVGWTPRKEALIDIAPLSRSAAAANSGPTTQMIPNRDIALTTIERPVDPRALVETVASYLDGCTTGTTIVYFDELGELIADMGADDSVSVLEELTALVREAGVRGLFCLDPELVPEDTVDRLCQVVDSVHGDVRQADEVERAVDDLRRSDPTNYGYARRHWREAREGIEQCNRNYPQARQIHETLEAPETTSRTLGATLKAFVTLGVIDTWTETVGSTRYDLTAYDGDLLTDVGKALDASD